MDLLRINLRVFRQLVIAYKRRRIFLIEWINVCMSVFVFGKVTVTVKKVVWCQNQCSNLLVCFHLALLYAFMRRVLILGCLLEGAELPQTIQIFESKVFVCAEIGQLVPNRIHNWNIYFELTKRCKLMGLRQNMLGSLVLSVAPPDPVFCRINSFLLGHLFNYYKNFYLVVGYYNI